MSADLFYAIEQHDAARVAELLSRGADSNAVHAQWPHYNAIHAAINELEDGGPIATLEELLKHGATVDAWDATHTATPLLMALFRGQHQAARILLDAGADPNVRGSEGDTPLRWSVENKNGEMVALLLQRGAAKTIDDVGQPRGRTALGLACEHLELPMVKMLLDAGADPSTADEDGLIARERLPPRETSDPKLRAEALELLARGSQ